jgi:hypothetical protein
VSKLNTPTDLSTLLSDELGDLFEKLVESGRRDPEAAIAQELRALDAATPPDTRLSRPPASLSMSRPTDRESPGA